MNPEHSAQTKEAYFSRLLEVTGDLLCVLAPNGAVLFAHGGLAALGYSGPDLVGENFLEYLHPDDATATRERLHSATPGGDCVRFESRLRGKGGAYLSVAWVVSRSRDETCAAVIRDVTERKWVEHELEASLSLVEAALESTADGILVADVAGKVVTFNRKFLEMWGAPDAVVFGGACEVDGFCDELLAVSDGHLSMSRELGEAAEAERYEVLTLKDGRVFERYSRPRRLRGSLEGKVWSFRDITERVRAERELREHLSMGIEHAFEGIGRLDPNGNYVSVNSVLAQMLGYDEKELIGTGWASRCHPDDRARIAAVREAMPADGKNEVEGRAIRKDGSVVLVRALIVRVGEKGGAGGYHVFMRDITEQKEMQERLLLADRMASMGTLAAGVAHEINNPLSFVIANLGVLSELVPTLPNSLGDKRLTEVSELLGDIKDGAERVRKIVRDLKMFSRPDDTKSEAVDVRQVLESCANMAWTEVRHRARFVKDYGITTMVVGNDAQLGQVFLNLLINAAQAIPEGNVERNEIRIQTTTDAEGWVVVEIRDTGAGIAPAILPRIFDPFFTTKPVGLGTGLGLSVCHGIVAKLGGEITAESKPGQGATFRVRLRRGEQRPKSERPPARPPAAACSWSTTKS
jgi:PAS domain S-box-containing protein